MEPGFNQVIRSFEHICPICEETLKRPIRILRCDHNICEHCLELLFASTRPNRCLVCSSMINLKFGIEELIRNYSLEHEIAGMNPLKVPSEKILNLLKKAQNCLKKRSVGQAVITCIEAISLWPIVDCYSDELLEAWLAQIQGLIKQFLNLKHTDISLQLNQCAHNLLKVLKDGEKKLKSIIGIGVSMKNIARELMMQNQSEKFEEQYTFMNTMVNELLRIVDVDIKTKNQHISWFLGDYGFSCTNYANDHQSAIRHLQQAISFWKAAFGDQASFYKDFAIWHHNLAVAYAGCNKLENSKTAYQQAIKVKKKAFDYKNEKLRNDDILFSSLQLQRIEERLEAAETPEM